MEEHPEARKIVETLHQAGFIAYYAGGWVRDLLLKCPSDDIDIATNAPPETIQALFPKTVPIGIAFGIILVIIDDKQYEVATFRQDLDYEDGRRPQKISFTTPVEDAKRRDFTINGMFYDPIHDEILDYVEGKKDLQAKIIRAIGDPHQRIQEDRLRMIRAVRLACRFDFTIEEKTKKAILAHAKELFPAVAIERVVQELKKGANFHNLSSMLIELHKLHLLSTIFPSLEELSTNELASRLQKTDAYPPKSPLIAYLLPLFPQKTGQEQVELCKYLKLPNIDQQFVLYLDELKTHLEKEQELATWARLYASPFSQIALKILAASFGKEFLQEHETRQEALYNFIERIQNNRPVVKAKDLQKLGIQPGPLMGILLAEAHRIAINSQTEDPNQVITKLKQGPLWPT